MMATNLATRPELRGEEGRSDQRDRTNPETWQMHSLAKPGSLSPCAFSALKGAAPTKAKTEPAKETPGQGKGRAGGNLPTYCQS